MKTLTSKQPLPMPAQCRRSRFNEGVFDLKIISLAVRSSRSVLLAGGVSLAAGFGSQSALAQPGSADWALLDEYCTACHNLDDFAGSVAFDLLDREQLAHEADTWELAIRKIKAGMMPPKGEPRPPRPVLDGFADSLAAGLDQEYARQPNPGSEGMGRLNREEYTNAIRDLLQFDASHVVAKLPAESMGEGFNNNVEQLSVSPTLIDAFASAAMVISREAVGDMTLIPTEVEYPSNSGRQTDHVEGLPLGTRGGLLITHNFPLDARYDIMVNARRMGGVFNPQAFCNDGNEIVLTIDGQKIDTDDPARTQLPITAGPHEIGASMIDVKRCTGVDDLYENFDMGGAISSLAIGGPFEVSGAGDTPSRQAIFSCYPQTASEEPGCAREIMTRLAGRAFRQPLAADSPEVNELLEFFNRGNALEGFEVGIQYAISRLLIDPRFLYQVEEQPEDLAPGELYAISDLELASRLSFFLWSSIPDDELINLAMAGELHEPDVLEQQVVRMMRDPRSEALVQNFAGQWLRLRDLDIALPQDPAFNASLRSAFRRETEMLFRDMVLEDKPLLTLIDNDYTWMNETLARHYDIDGVQGDYMRRVPLPEDSPRRGLLGHGSVLTATSTANRTSPVIRGAWIVEDILGTPVPTPPPGVETDLSEENDPEEVVINTLRDRLELHRQNPSCQSCHQIMDPIGLALENFDLIGRWRETENGHPLNTATELMDGTPIAGPTELRAALLERGDLIASTFVEKLLSYALGREVHAEDMGTVRAIIADTADDNYRFSDVLLGIVQSQPFKMKVAVDESQGPQTASN